MTVHGSRPQELVYDLALVNFSVPLLAVRSWCELRAGGRGGLASAPFTLAPAAAWNCGRLETKGRSDRSSSSRALRSDTHRRWFALVVMAAVPYLPASFGREERKQGKTVTWLASCCIS
jgi:hypothetical protein